MAYEPRTSFDWTPIQDTTLATERLNRQEAQAYSKRIQEAWEFARSDMKLAQERYMLSKPISIGDLWTLI
jgi:hypothetical protein